jgi:DNA-binding CsgD family transcriptional regulator
MPQKVHLKENPNGAEQDPTLIGKFSIDDQLFKIILLTNSNNLSDETHDLHEVIRFKLRGHTVAIVEEAHALELDGETRNMIARLTGRELQIAAMIAQGDATKNVAYKLRISEWTVGTHLRRIFAKLGVDNRAAMVYRCAALIENSPAPPPATTKRPPSRFD